MTRMPIMPSRYSVFNKHAQLGNFINRYDGMILLALIIHYLIKWPLGFDVRLTFYFDILFAVVVWFLIFPPEQRTRQTFVAMLIVFALEVFLRGLPGISDAFANLNFTRYILNPLFTPWWAIYGIIINPGGTFFSFVFRWGLIAYLLSILFLAIGNMPGLFNSDVIGPEQEQAVLKFWDNAKKFWKDMGFRVQLAYRNVRTRIQTSLTEATGGYYQGKVEKNRFEPLGVYLENIKAADPEFDRSEAAVILGTLKVKTLEDGITVNLDCYKGRKDDKEKIGKVTPATETVYDLEELPIDCTFDPYTLEQGPQSITIRARYNFETQAYLKTYFIDKERLRTFQRRNIDVLDQFEITEKQPLAVFTNGPARIGMGLGKQPVGIDIQTKPQLGITIENQPTWQGKIKRLTDVVVQLPEGLALEHCPGYPFAERDRNECVNDFKSHRTKQYSTCLNSAGFDSIEQFETQFATSPVPADVQQSVDACLEQTCTDELEGYREYAFDIDPTDTAFENIDTFKTIACRLAVADANANGNIDQGDVDRLLGTDPLKTVYIRTKARYAYDVEDSIMIRVKQTDPVVNVHTAPLTDAKTLRKIFHNYYINDYLTEEKPLIYAFPEMLQDPDEAPIREPLTCLTMALMAVASSGDPHYVGPYGDCKGVAALCKEVAPRYPHGYLNQLAVLTLQQKRLTPASRAFRLPPPTDPHIRERLEREERIELFTTPSHFEDTPLCDQPGCISRDYRTMNVTKSIKAAFEYIAYLDELALKRMPTATPYGVQHGAAIVAAYLSGEHPENTPASVEQSILNVIAKKLVDVRYPSVTLTRPYFNVGLFPPRFDIKPTNFFEWFMSKFTVPPTVRITGDDLKSVSKYKYLSDDEREEIASTLSYQLVRVGKLVDDCMKHRIVSRGTKKDNLNTDPSQYWLTLPRPVPLTSNFFTIPVPPLSNTAANVQMMLEFTRRPSDGFLIFSLYLQHGADDKPVTTLVLNPTQIKPDTWYWKNYPFFQIKFDGRPNPTVVTYRNVDGAGTLLEQDVMDLTGTAPKRIVSMSDSQQETFLTARLLTNGNLEFSLDSVVHATRRSPRVSTNIAITTVDPTSLNPAGEFVGPLELTFSSQADTSSFRIRVMKPSVITQTLYEEEPYVSQAGTTSPTDVWGGILKARYRDPTTSGQNIIEIYTEKDRWPGKLCEVAWGSYPIVEECEALDSTQNQLPGFVVRNLNKEDYGARVVRTQPTGGRILVDYTDVQFEFNPEYIEFE